MSDYEACNQDVWEEGSLPGAPALPSELNSSLTKTIHHQAPRPQPFLVNGTRRQDRGGFPFGGDTNDNTISSVPLNGYPPTYHGPPNRTLENYRPQIQGVLGRTSGFQGRQGHFEGPAVDNAAYDRYKSKAKPDGTYTFNTKWEVLLRNIGGSVMSASREARNRLNQICLKSDSYIPTPDADADIALVYGSKEQVLRTCQELDFFEKDVRSKGPKTNAEVWGKTRALDGRKEHREERDTKLQEFLTQYHLSVDDMEWDFEQFLLWREDLDMEYFIIEYDSTALQGIRREFICRIKFDTNHHYLQISANSEKELHTIRSRLINLVREMVAKFGQRVRINLLQPPSKDIYRSHVGMDKEPTSQIYLPTLYGEKLPPDEVKKWVKLCRQISRGNRQKVSFAIENSLRSMQLSQHHVRMRITFGELGFLRFRRAPNGAANHTFDQFFEMVNDERTIMKSQSLRSTQGDLSQIVVILDEMEEFSEPATSYSVYFDFQVGDHGSTLRLENEFKYGNDGKELERAQSRWLEYRRGDDSDLVEVNSFEFEKPNWTLHLGAVPFHENQLTKDQLRTFEHNLSFKDPKEGVKAPPKRRAIYPPGRQELQKVSELSMVRYQFKDTQGILELRRTDVYSETAGKDYARPLSSDWTAAYYYPEWDNLLAEFGYIKPGEQVSWPQALPTFFPDSEDAERPDGFKKFMRELAEIQDLLGEAIANLPVSPEMKKDIKSEVKAEGTATAFIEVQSSG